MSELVTHVNEVSTKRFGDLTPRSETQALASRVPVLATPAAVAAGVAVTAAAFGIGYAIEEAADG